MKCSELGIVEFEVVWGGDKLSPVQFNFGDVGEVRIKVRPKPDDEWPAVFDASLALAQAQSKAMFETRMEEHLYRVRAASEMAENARRAKVSR